MKKALMLMLGLILAASLMACSSQNEVANSTEQASNSTQANTEETSTKGEPVTLTIGISVRNIENPYYVQVKNGVELFTQYMAEQNSNVTFDIQFIACNSSDEQQVSDVQAIIARGGENTVIYIDPNNASVCSSVAKICEEAGVYWCSVWSYADGVYPWDYQYYAFHQSPGQVDSVCTLCLDLFKTFDTPDTGNVLFIKGLEGNTASQDRYAGFCQAIDQSPNVTVLDVQNGDWNPQTAQDLTSTWLDKYGADNIDAIVCANDEMALAVIETLKAESLNGKIKVTGFDGIDDALSAISDGNMYGTVGANPYLEGGLGVAYLYACWHGDVDISTLTKDERCFLTEPQLITPENIEDAINSTPELDFANYMGMIYGELNIEG